MTDTRTVLVVDDDPLQVDNLRDLLLDEDYEPLCALGCREALELARARRPAVVLADLRLPDGSGLGLVSELKEMFPEVFSVLITGNADLHSALEAMDKGAYHYLVKPIRPEELLRILRRIFETIRLHEEKRRAEAALRENQALLQTVIDTIPHALHVMDPGGRFIMVNNAMVRFAGLPAAEILGRGLQQVPPGTAEEKAEFHRVHQLVCRSGEPMELPELPLTLADGRAAYFHVTELPLRDEGGALWGLVTLLEDITGQKQLEEQLRQAQKMEAVGQLAGGVAHDFNNLLQIIMGYTQLAMKILPKEEAARGYLADVQRATEKASVLTNQLLAFSRKQVMSPAHVDLNEVIDGMTKLLKRVIEENITLAVELNPEPVNVFADPGMIEQVILNLCVNSRDAMPSGGQLVIRTETLAAEAERPADLPLDRAGAYAVLTIRDTGIGMTSEVQKRIFEPFFTTKEQGKGTGLGLAVVYGIIKQHDGGIRIDSAPGCGTTIQVFLPLRKGRADRTKVDQAELEFGRGGTETVLVAEDDEGVRKLLVQTLRLGGYTVLTATNGKAAWDLFDEQAGVIDLVVLDVVMPAASGREVYEHIRGRRPEVPIIFFSGYSSHIVDKAFIASEKVTLMKKPVLPNAFLAEVRSQLDARKVGALEAGRPADAAHRLKTVQGTPS